MQKIIAALEQKRAERTARRRPEAHRGPARQGQAHRPRAARGAARSGLASRNTTCSSPTARWISAWTRHRPRRRRGHRLGHHQRPHGLCLQPGFHGVRRLAVAKPTPEDLQDHGPRRAERRPRDRPQRQRRRPHPGRRRGAGRLCRSVLAQRAGLRRRAADFGDHGADGRRRGLFAGHDRLHLHGEGHLASCT